MSSKTFREMYPDAAKRILIPAPSSPLSMFPNLQAMTGGLRPFEFSILCGSTGTGKTTFCANLTNSLITDRIPHFVASVETGPHDYINRVMSARIGKDWNTGDPVDNDEFKNVHREHGQAVANDFVHLSLYDNRFPVEKLMADIKRHVETNGVKIAIVDNLNFFMEITRSADQIVEMDRVIHELIIFCKQVPVHIIMVMHPKKTENGRVENEFDIKGSSTAVQEAHNVFLFNRPRQSLIDDGHASPSDRELKIAKMRRRGKYVNSFLVFRGVNGVQYTEGAMFL